MLAKAGNTGDTGWIPGSKRSLWEENNNSLQYSCLEYSIDRGAWRATVQEVAKRQTWLRILYGENPKQKKKKNFH